MLPQNTFMFEFLLASKFWTSLSDSEESWMEILQSHKTFKLSLSAAKTYLSNLFI